MPGCFPILVVGLVLSASQGSSAEFSPTLRQLMGLVGQSESDQGFYYDNQGSYPEAALVVPKAESWNQPPSTPAPGIAGCLASINGVTVTQETRAACVGGSRIVLENPPVIGAVREIREGNAGEVNGFHMDEAVACEFAAPPPYVWKNPGRSEKFSCYRINANTAGPGKYFNSRGALIADAVSVGAYGTPASGLLLDKNGNVIRDASGKNQKADQLKVKYYLGDKRMREPFTEATASRLFWALGIPTDHVFSPKSVTCHGCAANPFQSKQMRPTAGSLVFQWTSIERSFAGVTVESEPDQDGWEWQDLMQSAKASGQMAQFEALLLASRLIAMTRPKARQNKIKCIDPNPVTGQCGQAVSIVHDLGSSFGKPAFTNSPRGDLKAYASQRVFEDKNSCSLNKDYLGHRVSEAGRSFFAQRLLKALGSASSHNAVDGQKVRALFEVGHFEGIDRNPRDDGELDAWTEQMTRLIGEVLTARCPDRSA